MLISLSIRNFRALEHLVVPQLGRVNLIVGKNNSGKSSILEALRIYAQNASSSLLDELILDHDESLPTQADGLNEDDQAPYQNFFTGRNFPVTEDGAIYIGDHEEQNFVKIAHTYYVTERIVESGLEDVVGVRRIPIAKSDITDEEDVRQALLVSSSRREQSKWVSISNKIRRNRTSPPDSAAIPVGYVPTGILPSNSLADLWDSVALTDYDQVVRDGLRIIEPRVEGVAFVKRQGIGVRSRTAIIKLEGSDSPVALNSMGDGMMRVLQVLLLLVPAKGGLYLVDEFENGLHYSVQEKVWKMVFELAKANNVQVFAATHSWDCIEAFKNVCLQSTEPALLFRVGQSARLSEKGKTVATVFDQEALTKLTQMDVEVR